MKKLEGKELYRRLQEAKNAQKLLVAMRQKMEAMEKVIELLKETGKQKDEMIVLQKEINEQQALRIEYLEKIVFGKSKKKRPQNSDDENDGGSNSSTKDHQSRDPHTHQREIPKDEEITRAKEYSLDCCPDCQGPLTDKRTVERFEEDIVLPLGKKNPLKTIEKQLIESGWCSDCKAQKSAKGINGSKVFLGQNAKIMTVYLSVVMRLSYEQIQNIFRDIYHLKISDGEIENILEDQGNRLIPEHEKIAKELFQEAAHYDETTWKTLYGTQGNYCWIKTGVTTTNTLFLFGRSRGKGNAEELCDGSRQIGITDDYPGYDSVFTSQALCWSHPNRKLRDLAESKIFEIKTQKNCKKMYEEFAKLYRELNEFPGTFEERKAQKEKYVKRFEDLMVPDENDPKQLKIYKKTLKKEQKKYFIFIETDGIPMDNNRAERRLRHVVLKRKICLGSKTAKGAKMLEKLYSVVLTWWWKDPLNFISNYRHLLA